MKVPSVNLLSIAGRQRAKATRGLAVGAVVAAVSLTNPALAGNLMISVDMKSYHGQQAYLAAYIVGPDDEYVATVYVAGTRMNYLRHMSRWFRLVQRSGRGIDGASGASIGSRRSITTQIGIPDQMLNAGYTLRVESSVENQNYFPNDASVALDDAHDGKPVAGTGYVQSLKISY